MDIRRAGFLSLSICLIPMMLAGCERGPSPSTPIPTRFPAADRIVAIGDLHGDLDATRRALRLAGAVDDEDHWIGGRLVLVQTGDLLDRGGDEPEIFTLFRGIAEEAERAGGAVHLLNGNHELMNAYLDQRYVTEEGFRDFEDLVAVDPADPLVMAMPPERRARSAAFCPGGPWAHILSERNTAVIIGDNLFVHGGILPWHVEMGLDRMNEEIRTWLRGEAPQPDWIRGGDSPVWSRHFSDGVDREESGILAEVLDRLGVRRMVVGHTVQDGGVASFSDGRVWCIDVGMARYYGSNPARVLEIRGDAVRVLVERP